MRLPSDADLIAQLNLSVDSIEVRFRVGEVTAPQLHELKSAIDDARLRLWGMLNTTTGDDGVLFEERHKIRRARELCGRLSNELKAGSFKAQGAELEELLGVTSELSRAIDAVKG